MSLKAMYNELTEHYSIADRFGAISQSHNIAIEQIKQAFLGLRPHYKVLDLSVSDGNFLARLSSLMPEANFTGLNISAETLTQAHKIVSFTPIEANVTEANLYLPSHSQDLILAHFINAIPLETLFKETTLLARSNGYFSFITTTYDSFPIAQQHIANFIAQNSLLSKIVGHYYKEMVKNTTVAAGLDELKLAFSQHQFEIVAHARIEIPITLETIDELALFGIEGTWFLNSISIKMLPRHFLVHRLKQLFSHIFTFPYHDTHIIDVILAKK